ncbi:MAG: FHA domain-containing protein [Coriobacteriia bacterium]|nr:FHA domain-containing protein [Coriobacteriia bacterium]
MVDIVLLFGRLVLIGLLYLFLLAAVKTGIGIVGGASRRDTGTLALRVTRGPREITGVSIPLTGPVVIGRSPDADLVIADDFVSTTHARVSITEDGPVLEDLQSTNGTLLNAQPVRRTMPLGNGDAIELGRNRIEVVKL